MQREGFEYTLPRVNAVVAVRPSASTSTSGHTVTSRGPEYLPFPNVTVEIGSHGRDEQYRLCLYTYQRRCRAVAASSLASTTDDVYRGSGSVPRHRHEHGRRVPAEEEEERGGDVHTAARLRGHRQREHDELSPTSSGSVKALLFQASPSSVVAVNLDDQSSEFDFGVEEGDNDNDAFTAMVTVVFSMGLDGAEAAPGVRLAAGASDVATRFIEPPLVTTLTVGPLTPSVAQRFTQCVRHFSSLASAPPSTLSQPADRRPHAGEANPRVGVPPRSPLAASAAAGRSSRDPPQSTFQFVAPLDSDTFTFASPVDQPAGPGGHPSGTLTREDTGITTFTPDGQSSGELPRRNRTETDRFAKVGSNPYMALLENAEARGSSSDASRPLRLRERTSGPFSSSRQSSGQFEETSPDTSMSSVTSSTSSAAHTQKQRGPHRHLPNSGPANGEPLSSASSQSSYAGLVRSRSRATHDGGREVGDPYMSRLQRHHREPPHSGRNDHWRGSTGRASSPFASSSTSSSDSGSEAAGDVYMLHLEDDDCAFVRNRDYAGLDAGCLLPTWFPEPPNPDEDERFGRLWPSAAPGGVGEGGTTDPHSSPLDEQEYSAPLGNANAITAPLPCVPAKETSSTNGVVKDPTEPLIHGAAVFFPTQTHPVAPVPVPLTADASPPHGMREGASLSHRHGGPLSSSGSSSPYTSFVVDHTCSTIGGGPDGAGSSVSASLPSPPHPAPVPYMASVPVSTTAPAPSLPRPPTVSPTSLYRVAGGTSTLALGHAIGGHHRTVSPPSRTGHEPPAVHGSGGGGSDTASSEGLLNFDDILEPMVTAADLHLQGNPAHKQGTPSTPERRMHHGLVPQKPVAPEDSVDSFTKQIVALNAGDAPPTAVKRATSPRATSVASSTFSVTNTGTNIRSGTFGHVGSPLQGVTSAHHPAAVAPVSSARTRAVSPRSGDASPMTAVRTSFDGVAAAARRHGPFAASTPPDTTKPTTRGGVGALHTMLGTVAKDSSDPRLVTRASPLSTPPFSAVPMQGHDDTQPVQSSSGLSAAPTGKGETGLQMAPTLRSERTSFKTGGQLNLASYLDDEDTHPSDLSMAT